MIGICSASGCGKEGVITRGMCQKHYLRWKTDNMDPFRKGVCDIDGCEKPVLRSGLCCMHNTRKRRTGNPNDVKVGKNSLGARNQKPICIDGVCTMSIGQKRFVRFDEDDLEKVMEYKWCYATRGYCMNNIVGMMHHYLFKKVEGMSIDHINHDTLDNRKGNLRVCTHQQNIQNQSIRVDNKTGYRGVSLTKDDTFCAKILTDHIGTFKTAEEAAIAYNKRAKELFGEYALINKIPVFD